MARRRYVEISCDHCGQADYHHLGDVTNRIRKVGWMVSQLGDFCNIECRNLFLAAKRAAVAEKQKTMPVRLLAGEDLTEGMWVYNSRKNGRTYKAKRDTEKGRLFRIHQSVLRGQYFTHDPTVTTTTEKQ